MISKHWSVVIVMDFQFKPMNKSLGWGMGLGQGNLKSFYKGIQTWGIDIVGPISYHVPS